MTQPPAQQIPGVYHRKIGDIVVTVISDGYLDGNLEVMRNVDLDKAHKVLKDAFRPARRTSVNTFLIQSKGRSALVDTGSGDYLQKSAGKVQANLAAAGIDPKSIDTVLLTHMHPDHSAGLTEMPSGRLYFPNAELVMHENELPHWYDDAAMTKVDERSQKMYFLAGREQVGPYKKQTRLFKQGEVFPGVTAVPSHGHTPGHTAYLIEFRRRAADDLGRHGACAGGADRVSRRRHGVRHRSRGSRSLAQAHVRPRRHRRRAGRRHASAFPRVRAAGEGRQRVSAVSGGVGAFVLARALPHSQCRPREGGDPYASAFLARRQLSPPASYATRRMGPRLRGDDAALAEMSCPTSPRGRP